MTQCARNAKADDKRHAVVAANCRSRQHLGSQCLDTNLTMQVSRVWAI
jgi:hypothetical protein